MGSKIVLKMAAAAIGAAITFAASSIGAEETVGQKFRKVLADIELWCKENKVGPYLDPSDPEYNDKRRATDCNILRLQPRDWREVKMVKLDSQPYPVPEHWLATPEGRFAHSIKLPPPHDKPRDVYRPGMSGGEYFQALCKAEAGDFVFKTVENVEGIVRLRLPEIGSDDMLRHLFATEGTLGLSLGHIQTKQDTLGETLVQPPHGKYQFAETLAFSDSQAKDGFAFRQFKRDIERAPKGTISARDDQGNWISVPRIVVERGVSAPNGRYGYVWRGIAHPSDRELGISGAS